MATAKPAAPRKIAAKAAPAAKVTANAADEKASADTHAENVFGFAESARDQYGAFMKSFGANTEEFQERAHEAMDAAREGFETAQSRFQEVNAEAMDAARQEMSEAVDFANELARAKTVADAFEIQRDYWTNLFETRVERSRSLTQATVEAVRETVEPISKTMSPMGAFNTPAFTNLFPFAGK